MIKRMTINDFPKYLQERINKVWCECKDDFVDEEMVRGSLVCFVDLKDEWFDFDGCHTSYPLWSKKEAIEYVKDASKENNL